MRSVHLIGLLALSVATGCGGDSSGPDDPNQGSAGDDSSGDAGSNSGASGGEGGAGDGPSTGTGASKSGTGGASTGTGGVSSGGVAGTGTAGTPSMGGGTPTKGGSPGIPPMMPGGGGTSTPPPEGCVSDGSSASSGQCSMGLTCTNDYVKISCFDQGNGSWYCDCSSSTRYQSYNLGGVTNLAACEAAADLCASDEPPTPVGEEICTPQLESRAATYCQLQSVCSQELEGTSATTVTRTRYTSCQADASGRLQCSCDNGYTYLVEGEDGTTGCDTLEEVCKEPPGSVSFEGDPECAIERQATGTGYCETSQQCIQKAELQDGISVIQSSYGYANCSANGNGDSTCSCSSATSNAQFDIAGDATSLDSCNTAIGLCDRISTLETSGPIECAKTYQSADTQNCSAQLQCLQDGTIDDTTIRAYGGLNLNCSLLAAGTAWTCSCSSGVNYGNVEVEAADGWDACTAATDACQEAIEIDIGSTNGGIGRPPPGMPVPVPFAE